MRLPYIQNIPQPPMKAEKNQVTLVKERVQTCEERRELAEV
jgi:hypothetical protein